MNIEEYWDSKLVDRKGFITLLHFNNYDCNFNNYIICNDGSELLRFKAKNNNEAIKEFKLYLLKRKYNNNQFNILEFKDFLINCKDNNIKVCYMYDILGILSNFRINNKSITCYDSLNNKIRFTYKSDYIFYKEAILID